MCNVPTSNQIAREKKKSKASHGCRHHQSVLLCHVKDGQLANSPLKTDENRIERYKDVPVMEETPLAMKINVLAELNTLAIGSVDLQSSHPRLT